MEGATWAKKAGTPQRSRRRGISGDGAEEREGGTHLPVRGREGRGRGARWLGRLAGPAARAGGWLGRLSWPAGHLSFVSFLLFFFKSVFENNFCSNSNSI
jgi:hypothetical protein